MNHGNISNVLLPIIERLRKIESLVSETGDGRKVCNHCGKVFKNSGHVREHAERHHISGIAFACKLCPHKTKNRSAFRAHNGQWHRKAHC